MSTIDTRIDPFTKSPNRQQPATFSADMDTRLAEENSRITQMNNMSDEMNVVASELNAINVNVNNNNKIILGYRNETLEYKDLSLGYKTAAELAYNNTQSLLSTLVIPTEATYNYQGANDKFQYKTDSFLKFNIGE